MTHEFDEDYSTPEYWFEGPGGGACACGSYSCDGGCDSYAMRRQERKDEERYYEHLDTNGVWQYCGKGDCPDCLGGFGDYRVALPEGYEAVYSKEYQLEFLLPEGWEVMDYSVPQASFAEDEEISF